MDGTIYNRQSSTKWKQKRHIKEKVDVSGIHNEGEGIQGFQKGFYNHMPTHNQ